MADSEQPTSVEGTPAADVEMAEEVAAEAEGGAAEEETGLTEMEPETPKLVLFSE